MAVYLGNKLVDTIFRISYYKDVPRYFARTLGENTYGRLSAEDLQGLRKIKEYGFYNQKKLETVILPETVEEIGDNAFSECRNIRYIRFLSTTPPKITTRSLSTSASAPTIYVPEGCLDVYKNAENWSNHTNQLKEW